MEFVMKHLFWLWLLVAGAPLLIYPFVLLANVMSLAGHPSSNPVPLGLLLTSQGFQWSLTLYPIVYVYCAKQAIACSQTDDSKSATNLSVVPLLYLCLVAAFFGEWMIKS